VRNAFLRDCEGTFIVAEGGCEAITIDSLRIENGFAGRNNLSGPLISHLGKARVRYGDVWISGRGAYLYDTGGTTGTSIGITSAVFATDADPKIPNLAAFERELRVRRTNYSEIKRFSRTFNLTPNMSASNLDLPSGICRVLKIYASTTTGITALYLSNKTSNGPNIVSSLVSGQDVAIGGTAIGLGSGYVFNDLEGKRLIAYTDGTLPGGAYLTVEMEYFVGQGAADDGSAGRLQVG
jgi:hypothetical protein